jgi:hypothetical protein
MISISTEWMDYGNQVVLRQEGDTLVVEHDGQIAGKYTYFQTESFGNSSDMSQYLNSSGSFFKTAP